MADRQRTSPLAFLAITFVSTRLVVLAVILLFAQMRTVATTYGSSVHETEIVLGRVPLQQLLSSTFVVADAEWFRSVAESGYAREAFHAGTQRNWAFFPLFPISARYLRVLPGYALNAIVLANLFFLAALVVVYRLALAWNLDEEAARRCAFYVAIFPTSYFFSMPVSESLFLLTSSASLLLAKRERWLTASLAGALASATRVVGVLLLPTLVLLALEKERRWRGGLAWLLLIPAGLAGFMIHLWRITGNPLAFADIQLRWARHPGWFVTPLLHYVENWRIVSHQWNFDLLNALAAVLMILCSAWLAARREWALAFYLASSLVVALSSSSLQSMIRYAAVAVPIFVCLAILGERSWVDRVVAVCFLPLLGILSALYGLRFDIGLA